MAAAFAKLKKYPEGAGARKTAPSGTTAAAFGSLKVAAEPVTRHRPAAHFRRRRSSQTAKA